jgi:RloB-like protein
MNWQFFLKTMKRNKRKRNTRKTNPRILIFCEGQTEKYYLEGLKRTLPNNTRRSLQIDISCPSANRPKELLKYANKKKIDPDYNPKYITVWLVIDKDDHPYLKEVFNAAKSNGINIAYSSISIEIWFLLHFISNPKSFGKAHDAEKNLLIHLTSYKKALSNIYNLLQNNEATALKNAKILYASNQKKLEFDCHEWDLNPYTTMHLLIEDLRSR